jgi:hypothetical protein
VKPYSATGLPGVHGIPLVIIEPTWPMHPGRGDGVTQAVVKFFLTAVDGRELAADILRACDEAEGKERTKTVVDVSTGKLEVK